MLDKGMISPTFHVDCKLELCPSVDLGMQIFVGEAEWHLLGQILSVGKFAQNSAEIVPQGVPLSEG